MSVTTPPADATERQSFQMSVKLFKYWDTVRKPTFLWEVVDLPSFLAFHISRPASSGATEVVSTPLTVSSYKCRTKWSGELVQDLQAYGRPLALQEAEHIAFNSITNEVEKLAAVQVCKPNSGLTPGNHHFKLFFYRLSLSPDIFDSESFASYKALIVRYAYHIIEPEAKFVGAEICKHNFADATYERLGFTPYRWDSQNENGTVATPPQEIIDELKRQYELKMTVRSIKEKMGYVLEPEKESIF